MAPWWVTMQGWGVGLALLVAGYAWHDALRGRLPRAGRAALAATLAAAAIVAFRNDPVEHLAFAFAAAPALGWALRLPRADERALPLALDVGAGLAYAALATVVAYAWSEALVAWGFVVAASLVAARVLLLDPWLAWRASRAPAAPRADDVPADSTTVK